MAVPRARVFVPAMALMSSGCSSDPSGTAGTGGTGGTSGYGGTSTTVSLVATVASGTTPGTLIPFEAEVRSAHDSLAGASTTLSVCCGAGCPPAPPGAPDLLVCGGTYVDPYLTKGPCDRYNGTTQQRVGPFNQDLTDLYGPTFALNGALWRGRYPPGASFTIVYQYGIDGLLADSFNVSARIDGATASPIGNLYAVGIMPMSSPAYRLFRYTGPGTAEGVLPYGGASSACGTNTLGRAIAASPFDPGSPLKEELYLWTSDAEVSPGVTMQAIVKLDVSDTVAPCKGPVARVRVGERRPEWLVDRDEHRKRFDLLVG